MKTSIDTWLKIQGLKQTKRKEILYWQAWFGNTLIDQHQSIALLKYKWKGQNVEFKPIS
jgi:hypothetical protein